MYLRATAGYSDGEGSGKSAEVVSGASVADQEATLQLAVNPLVSGLTHPWGIAFAPDGTMLFTERGGVLSSSSQPTARCRTSPPTSATCTSAQRPG